MSWIPAMWVGGLKINDLGQIWLGLRWKKKINLDDEFLV